VADDDDDSLRRQTSVHVLGINVKSESETNAGHELIVGIYIRCQEKGPERTV